MLIIIPDIVYASTKLSMDLVDYPPRSKSGPPHTGFTVDLVNKIFAESQFKIEYKIVTWARSLVELSNGETDLALCTPETLKPSVKRKINMGILIFKSRITIFYDQKKYPDDQIHKELKDFKGLVIGNLRHSGFREQFIKAGLVISDSNSLDSLFKMLILGRLDLVNADDVSGLDAVYRLTKHSKSKPNILMLEKPLGTSDVHLCIGSHRSDSKDIRDVITKGMKRLLANGEYKKLVDGIYRNTKYQSDIIPYELYNVARPAQD